jgi:hypothetical protein
MMQVGNSDTFSQASCLRSDRRLQVRPVLPDWLPDLHLTHLNVGDATVDLHFWREDE